MDNNNNSNIFYGQHQNSIFGNTDPDIASNSLSTFYVEPLCNSVSTDLSNVATL